MRRRYGCTGPRIMVVVRCILTPLLCSETFPRDRLASNYGQTLRKAWPRGCGRIEEGTLDSGHGKWRGLDTIYETRSHELKIEALNRDTTGTEI
jgi:hypothetical protein